MTGIGTIGGASAVGGVLGARNNERAYSRLMYEVMIKKNPTNTNIDAVRKNFQKYKIGQGSAKADVFKKQFLQLRKEGGLRGAALLGATAAGALGMKAIYNKLKNRKTLKIAGKPIKIKGKTLSYQKSD